MLQKATTHHSHAHAHAVCCSVLQGVTVCCRVSAKRHHSSRTRTRTCSVLQCVAVCCSVLQCVAGCCNVIAKRHHSSLSHTHTHSLSLSLRQMQQKDTAPPSDPPPRLSLSLSLSHTHTHAGGCSKKTPFPPLSETHFPNYRPAFEPLDSWRALTALAVAGHWIKILR